jgi:hypothetical protein
MPNPHKTYIERVEQTKAVQITEKTLDDFRFFNTFVSFKLEDVEGKITYTFFWSSDEDIEPLRVPWGDYVILTWTMVPGTKRRKPHYKVVAQHDFEEKFVEDQFPLSEDEMQFLKHLYAKDVEELKRLRSQGLTRN